jgi:hypothetical protein
LVSFAGSKIALSVPWIEMLPVQCDTAKFAGFHYCWHSRRCVGELAVKLGRTQPSIRAGWRVLPRQWA